MKRTLAVVTGATIAFGAAALVEAQTTPAADAKSADVDKAIELYRKDVRAEKSDIIAKTMKLDAAQASAFWPVYKVLQVLPAKTVARFFQVDSRLNNLIDLKISSQIPLVN